MISKENAENVEYIYIETTKDEKNKYNNKIRVDYNRFLNLNKVLILSGQLSDNTIFIKDLVHLMGAKISDHYYKMSS